jgi:hypothetical protein
MFHSTKILTNQYKTCNTVRTSDFYVHILKELTTIEYLYRAGNQPNSWESVGGAMGNMICIHNIVAVCSVLGINNKEGFILKRTIWPMLLYGIIVSIVALCFF